MPTTGNFATRWRGNSKRNTGNRHVQGGHSCPLPLTWFWRVRTRAKSKSTPTAGDRSVRPTQILTSQMTSQYNEDSAGGTFWLHGKYRTRRRVLVNSLDATIKKGPQVVTRRGVKTAVLVPIKEWERLTTSCPAGPEGVVARSRARCDDLAFERGKLRSRPRWSLSESIPARYQHNLRTPKKCVRTEW